MISLTNMQGSKLVKYLSPKTSKMKAKRLGLRPLSTHLDIPIR